jgi:hypothetical protein
MNTKIKGLFDVPAESKLVYFMKWDSSSVEETDDGVPDVLGSMWKRDDAPFSNSLEELRAREMNCLGVNELNPRR